MTNVHPMQTRSKFGICKKKVFVANVSTTYKEPTSFTQASKSSDWQLVMTDEYNAFIKQGTWSLTPLPPNKHLIGCN